MNTPTNSEALPLTPCLLSDFYDLGAVAHINVHTLSLAGVGMIMVSLIVPWFWVSLVVSCLSLVLAVICLLAMIRRCGYSLPNAESTHPKTETLIRKDTGK